MFAVFLLTMLQIGGSSLEVEVADKPKARIQGLAGRKKLADGHGLLFVFEQAQPLFFWMKDTSIPLSIGFFNEKRQLIQIEDMEPFSHSYTKSKRPAQYALEVPQGWFEKQGICPGTIFQFK